MKIDIYQVDAFADRLFSGNPAAVCPLNAWIADDLMQSIAAENNLSETAFFVPQGEFFGLRWFTPTVEVNLCGHATLATAHVLYHHLGYSKPSIGFQTRSGLLTVEKKEELYGMDFPADQLHKLETPEVLVQGIGQKPLETYRGREDYLVVLEHQKQIEALAPNFAVLRQLEGRGVIATAAGKTTDFVSRCFYPNFGIDEDPVTGSAHTTLTPYWAEKLGKTALSASQLSKRGGNLTCVLAGSRVEILGQAVTYMVGQLVGERIGEIG